MRQKSKKIIVILAALVIIVAAVAVGIVVSKNKVPVEEPTSKVTVSDVTTTEKPTTTEPKTDESTTETTAEAPSTTKAPETTRAPQTTRAPETTTRKQETTTKKQETTTKAPSTTKSSKDEILEELYAEYNGKTNYENRIKNTAEWKCKYCGKHDCPGVTYIKDAAGNYSDYSFNRDKCPSYKPTTEYCRTCGKPIYNLNDVISGKVKPDGDWCDGNCALSVGG